MKLPALKVEAREDPAQHGDAPRSAPGRCSDLQGPCGLSPKGPCRSMSEPHSPKPMWVRVLSQLQPLQPWVVSSREWRNACRKQVLSASSIS